MSEDIEKILSSITPEGNWQQKLKNIKAAIAEYDKFRTGQSSHNRDKIIESLNDILPTYWEVFHTHNTARRRNGELLKGADSDEACLPSYNIGIFLVGYSSLPIALSLAEIQPTEQIYFLYSKDTQEYLNDIDERLSKMLNRSNQALLNLVADTVLRNLEASSFKIDDPSDPVSTFKCIKEIIDNIDDADNKRIALDLTGGKKTMIGGGFTAGSIYSVSSQCDMFYVDSLVYDPDRGAPKPGTEFLSTLENPYDVYNIQSNLEAEKLFNNHNYEAAAILWSAVGEGLESHAERYGLEEEQDAVQRYLDMADCYGLWDAFDYKTACERKKSHEDSWQYNQKHVNCAIDVLEILSEVEDPQTLFAEEARIIHYAVDRYQNGIRRMESDRFDDAIVRFTQVVEILCRYQVYRIETDGSLTYQNHKRVPQGCCLDEHWRISELIRFLFRDNWIYGHRYNITNQRMRLNINNYCYNNTDQITDLIEARNDFVHVNSNPGWEEMQKDAENLQELAKTFLENFSSSYCCNNGLSFDELLELHKFRR